MEVDDVTSLLSQATLLVLLIPFLLALLHLGIIQVREALITGQTIASKFSPPSTPGFKVANLLALAFIFLWSASVVLMSFCKGLLYLVGKSMVLLGLFYLVYLTIVLIPTMKAFQKLTEG